MKDDERTIYTNYDEDASSLRNKTSDDLMNEIEAYIDSQSNSGLGIDQGYIENRLSVLQERDPIEFEFDPEVEINDLPLSSLTTQKESHHTRNWHRAWRIAEIAALVVLMFAIIAGAGGFNLFDFIRDLQAETITFEKHSSELIVSTSDDTNNTSDFASLQEALDAHGIATKLCPTWIPEDYILQSVDVISLSDSTRFSCDYVSDRGILYIQINVSNSSTSIRTEEIEPEGTLYEKGGVNYYIISNTNNIKCNWINDGYDCRISGVVTFDEMTEIIDSIK